MQELVMQLRDEEATDALGSALARILVPGLAIFLHGELGAGKTSLTRAMLHAAGHTGRVKSPTYTLVEPYTIQLDDRPVDLLHFDLYRMGDPREFLDAGFRDCFNENAICIVEWPEKAEAALPLPDINIFLYVDGLGRKVKLQGMSDKGSRCLKRLHFAPNL